MNKKRIRQEKALNRHIVRVNQLLGIIYLEEATKADKIKKQLCAGINVAKELGKNSALYYLETINKFLQIFLKHGACFGKYMYTYKDRYGNYYYLKKRINTIEEYLGNPINN